MKERRTKSGKPMAHLTLSDSAGAFEVTLFEETLTAARSLLTAGQSLVLDVEMRLEGETLRLTANRVDSIDRVAERAGRGLRIFLNNPSPLPSLKAILERAKGGRGRVTLVANLDNGAREVEIMLPGRYGISPAVRNAVMAVSGVVEAEEL